MVDIITTSSHGHRFNALSQWAANIEEPLTDAIGDFPKRGIAVSQPVLLSRTIFIDISLQFGSLPRWLWNLVSRIPHQRWRKLCDSDKVSKPNRHLPKLSLFVNRIDSCRVGP